MPADITGIHYHNQKSGEFEFRPEDPFRNRGGHESLAKYGRYKKDIIEDAKQGWR